jgi:SagB-type dehydrogenase family enzyme
MPPVVVFHTADLKAATAAYGDRVYRYLHMDAGHLGQRLNLAAIYLGLGVSGIGGFYDDQVNDVLGLPEPTRRSRDLYHHPGPRWSQIVRDRQRESPRC